MIITTENILLIGSLLLFVSLLAGRAGYKFGVPALLLFLGVGMLFGTSGVGIVFDSPESAQFIGMVALCIILFSGGMDTSLEEIKPVVGEGVTLATFGVIITAGVTGAFIYLVAGLFGYTLNWMESLLLASVMASTDSASVFSILRSKRMGLKQNLRPLLELESGSNDPMAYMLTITLIGMIQTGQHSVGQAAMMVVYQLGVGALSGYLLGRLAVIAMNRVNIGNHSLYSVMILAVVFFTFAFTDLIHGNGYLAVYIAGLVVGNRKSHYKKSITTFFDGFAWLAQIVMFLTLGLLVNPSELWVVAGLGLLVGIFMIVVSRPLATFACLVPFKKLSTRARWYVSWVGLRGAVPIIFATYPMIAGLENARLIFNVVFFITIVSLLIQGTTVGKVAEWLGVGSANPDNEGFDVILPEKLRSGLTRIEVTPGMLEKGNLIKNISLPHDTLVVVILRGEKNIVPKGDTQLEEGDQLMVVTERDSELAQTYRSLGVIERVNNE